MHVEAAALIAHITTDRAPLHSTSFTTPKDFNHATDPTRTPDYREWIEAIRKEYHLLDQTMGCWEIVDIETLPEDANLIGVKWVFKIKFKNGVYERHKARIVALGYQQRKDVDYFASFSPTASYVTIRLVLALTALPHWYGVDFGEKCLGHRLPSCGPPVNKWQFTGHQYQIPLVWATRNRYPLDGPPVSDTLVGSQSSVSTRRISPVSPPLPHQFCKFPLTSCNTGCQ